MARPCHIPSPSLQVSYPDINVQLVQTAVPGKDGGTHTVVMTFARLHGKEGTDTGYQDTCRCLQVEGKLGPETKRLRKPIKKTALSTGFKQQAGTIFGLLRDWAVLTINRSLGRMREVRAVIKDIITILQAVAHEQFDEENYDPYDGTPQLPGPPDPEIGARRLGVAGEVPFPQIFGTSTSRVHYGGCWLTCPTKVTHTMQAWQPDRQKCATAGD